MPGGSDDTAGDTPAARPSAPPSRPASSAARESRPELPTYGASGSELPTLESSTAHTSSTRETLFGFMTGRQAGGALGDGDRSAQLIAAYGASRRDPDRPDTAAAAKGLGVSTRSVQRWLKGGGISAGHADKLRTVSRQAMTTKRGRERAARLAGAPKLPPGRNAVTVTGEQGVISGDTGNYRTRDSTVQFTNADLQTMQQLWVEHGEDGAAAFLHQHFGQHYVEGWHFRSIDEISWGESSMY
ncbi:MAG: hypothetical protein L0H96_22515 [Humibacillus sp.]|nr:hypothetical protein [Humibacillus sp.]